ncbi:hypothetical protein ABBQ38_006174 [Trebouxia sp. C0009 RCD-2024]
MPHAASCFMACDFAVIVEVSSPELPTVLQQQIAAQLQLKWQETRPQAGVAHSLHLMPLFQHLERDFVSLITCLPEFLEPYQSVNAGGATVRRYAIINPDNQVHIDTHAAPAKTHSQTPPAASTHKPDEPATRAAAPATSRSHITDAHSMPPNTTAVSNAMPAGMKAALTYMQRRYGAGLTIHDPAPASTALPDAKAIASPGCTFSLTMQPTDPAWDAKELHRLQLQGQLTREYPKQDSYSICVDSQQNSISASAGGIVNQLIAAEARRHAGRPGALQQLLRFVDNRAGMLFHEADDIVLEAAQRRKQAHSSAGSQPAESHRQQQPSKQGQAPPPPEETGNPQGGGAEKQGALPASADASSTVHHVAADPAASLAAGLEGMHVTDETQDVHTGGQAASELDSEQASEGYWSESHWDSSASYTGPDQQTSESDHQHDSSDAEHASHSGRAAASSADVNDRNALQLHLQDLNLDNVDALEGLKLNIQMVCNRCHATSELAFASDAVASGSQQGRSGSIQVSAHCAKCHQDWFAALQPRLVHAHSNVLASIRAQGCAPLDLLPSLMAAQCSNCTAAASLRNAQVGLPCSRACSTCHTSMTVHFQAAMFLAAAPPPAADGTQPRRPKPRQRPGTGARAALDPALVIGQPLPHMGTCKHYHHSHRWLRFPCCGRRFACDLCHEEQTDGHEMKWALRMVCGYCSHEQPLGEQCQHCGKRIARTARGALGAVTTHWQGGEGCRDKRTMDRRDAAKYRNSKHKSVSKKTTRVGKEGAARRQRGQKADK